MARARENDWRVQPISCVMGKSHSPKPWRMPMDRVTMAAPQASTWNMDSLGVFCEFICMRRNVAILGKPRCNTGVLSSRPWWR